MAPKSDNQLFSTSYQKVLKFLAAHPAQEYIEREVREAVGISKAGANNALRALAGDQLVEVEKKGRLSIYHADPNNPLIRQTKVLINIMEIEKFVTSIRDTSYKIILFGSAASGTDAEDSDIDLFVLSDRPGEVRKTAGKIRRGRPLHLVVRKPIDYVSSKRTEKVFHEEVSRGIVLYERPQ